MIFYPNMYYSKVQEIPIEDLMKKGIKGIVLDSDNTLIDLNKNMPAGVKEWVNEAKERGIKLCLLSNTNKVDKIKKVSEILGIPYFYFAKKPLSSGFKKVQKLMKLEKKEMASIGDQIFTDVLGANIFGITSIFVEPISNEDYLITRIKRPLEKLIVKNYLKKEKRK